MKLLKTDSVLIAWIVLVFVAISWPGDELPKINLGYSFDKIVHIILFGGVTFLTERSLNARGYRKGSAATISLAAGVAYSGLAEIIQMIVPGRYHSFYDFYAGILGAIIALVVICFKQAPCNR